VEQVAEVGRGVFGEPGLQVREALVLQEAHAVAAGLVLVVDDVLDGLFAQVSRLDVEVADTFEVPLHGVAEEVQQGEQGVLGTEGLVDPDLLPVQVAEVAALDG
jgi:hypothetical protein